MCNKTIGLTIVASIDLIFAILFVYLFGGVISPLLTMVFAAAGFYALDQHKKRPYIFYMLLTGIVGLVDVIICIALAIIAEVPVVKAFIVIVIISEIIIRSAGVFLAGRLSAEVDESMPPPPYTGLSSV